GMAIATLQFNCHLALLFVCLLPAYSYLSTKYVKFGALNYKPLGQQAEELQDLDVSGIDFGARFALDSDEDKTHETPPGNLRTMPEVNGINQVPV
ncbi:hypothetical protein KI387_013922, partial [Taxus chinensis]